MRLPLLVLLCALAVQAGAQTESLSPLPAAELEAALRKLGADRNRAEVLEVGKSREGRSLLALRIGAPRPAAADFRPPLPAPGLAARAAFRPTILLVSGLESDALVGSAILLEIARRRLALAPEDFASRFAGHDLLIVPRVDLDGAERFFAATPRHDLPGSATPIDQDRDGRALDEDPPVDLDGDGEILEMRWPDPEGDLVPDEKDPRLLVPADETRRGIFKRAVEASDRDGDGDCGEDPAVGVRLDRNFPHRFVEHDLESGPYPMSEPETRALAEFVLARPEIALVVVLGTHDDLARVPEAEKGEPKRREPRTAPTKKDRAILETIAELLKKEGAVFAAREQDTPGSFEDWCRYQLGLPAAAVCLFEARAPAEGKKKGEGGDRKPAEAASESRPAEDIVAVAAERTFAEAFRDWRPHEHPRLGAIEIGGFRPYLRRNPDPAIAAEIAARQDRFLAGLEDLLARPAIADVELRALGAGHFEIELSVINDGALPTTTEQGATCRRPLPLQLVIDLPRERILQGEALTNLPALAARVGRRRVRWLVTGRSGEIVRILLAPPHDAAIVREVRLP